MRVYVYSVLWQGKWRCRFTLDWRVDVRYWFSQAVANGVRENSSHADVTNERCAPELWITTCCIPLGTAVDVVGQWGESRLEVQRLVKLMQDAEPGILDWFGRECIQVRRIGVEEVWREIGIGVIEEHRKGKLEGEGGILKESLWSDAVWKQMKDESDLLAAQISGRALLANEVQELMAAAGLDHAVAYWRTLAQLAYIRGQVKLLSGITTRSLGQFSLLRRQRELQCLRCGSSAAQHHRTACAACGNPGCAYCEACLAMGRSRRCALLVHGTAVHNAGASAAGVARAAERAPATEPAARWRLSEAQHDASRAALHFLQQPSAAAAAAPSFLLWAVTGAGKTEMIFPLIAYTLERGQHVLIATPRRDVVLELAPRLAQAFPEHRLVTLYGGSEERWTAGDITLSTTHQLMRFYHKFDVVIVDELDAFPYHNNELLQYAARKACKPEGKFIFLSATPPEPMQREVRRGRLPHAKVPVRFHRHPLPVPQRLTIKPLRHYLENKTLPKSLLHQLSRSVERGAQLFLFITRIKQTEAFVQLLRHYFPVITIEGTSSEDKERGEKVTRFRNGQSRMLVTTTILERGVTIPKSDVFIIDADSALFDAASLVQMAGRAGRSKDDPAGHVLFCAAEWNRAQRLAVRQIVGMNRIARRQGYLLPTDTERSS
ncbi:DNA/RNA helicase [Paenibacillus selenitireducens]|uniref:DNA/RNA helicase n=1 Tax=Paenibacillus selenitireducens TaxID=1324314 RepID=A0A1T2X703_9BACL|nr:helicase-related protein [Paenibacillus selenitireducens]OPA75668.1 DNA/RNA helicase [Paenibacillus selenitireducens]